MVRGMGLIAAVVLLAACGSDDTSLVVRAADEVQVMTPEQVSAARAQMTTTLVPLVEAGTGPSMADPSTDGSAGAPSGVPGTDATVPQNVDNRPPELRLFDAFGKFRSCIDDAGYTIEGDLTDPNNPAYQDSKYLETVQTCAARSDIVTVLQEVQATRANLTPEEVEQRNEAFKALQECLEGRSWTIETQTNEIGLIEPAVFQGPDGTLDERDLNQCLSETGITEAVEEGAAG